MCIFVLPVHKAILSCRRLGKLAMAFKGYEKDDLDAALLAAGENVAKKHYEV